MAKAKSPRTKQNGEAAPPPVNPSTVDAVSEIREVRRTAPNLVPINLDDEIRRRAYELWEQHGRESGHEEEHWFLAEQEIRARYHAQRQSA